MLLYMMRQLKPREIEILHMIHPATFDEIVEEVRESLPPTKTMMAQYMRACKGLSQNRGCRGRGSPAALAREESYPTLR
jgi:hypothetical protein